MGKTTFAKILAGEEKADKGRVETKAEALIPNPNTWYQTLRGNVKASYT